jgi:hypothetical protein
MRTLIIGTTVACGLFSSPAFTQQPSQGIASAQYGTIETKPPAGHGPTASEWSALANLPDWTGVWTPDIGDQERQEKENNVPWTAEAAAKIQEQIALENAGKPHGTHNTCLPWGMPGFMMLTHNAIEFLFTPGRITIIGEADGNNLRRIYTDGRPHPAAKDADPTFHGHSIGQWEGDTLVVDTDDILPQTEIALSEGVGIPNSGGMHIVERIHKASSNILVDDMEIVAPKILLQPYKTRRVFFRVGWGPEWDIVQGVCLEGNFVDQVDANGYAIFVPIKPDAK